MLKHFVMNKLVTIGNKLLQESFHITMLLLHYVEFISEKKTYSGYDPSKDNLNFLK